MHAAQPESSYLLSAIVEQKHAPELRTAPYSRQRLSTFLEDNPAAMTLAPAGTGNSERLLELFMDSELLHPLLESHRNSDPWLVFAEQSDQLQLHKTVRPEQIVMSVQVAAQKRPSQTIVMIRQTDVVRARFDALLKALRRVIGSSPARATGAAASAPPAGSDRDELIRIRNELLEQVGGTFSSEDLATAAQSITTNSSQLAADQRSSGKLFGVRWGREWRYPRFQFDPSRRLYPEIKDILSALSPDNQGWDRLQWFLEPHERLSGRTPLQVWSNDRRKVIEAANTERWDGRD